MYTTQAKKQEKKLQTSGAELLLTTEINSVRQRLEKTCPKKPRREKMRAGNLGRNQVSSTKSLLWDFIM